MLQLVIHPVGSLKEILKKPIHRVNTYGCQMAMILLIHHGEIIVWGSPYIIMDPKPNSSKFWAMLLTKRRMSLKETVI